MIEIHKIFLFLIFALLLLVVASNVRAASATLSSSLKLLTCYTCEDAKKVCENTGADNCCYVSQQCEIDKERQNGSKKIK